MHHRFRITYVRTAYCEIDVDAEDCRAAEGLFEEMAAAVPEALERRIALTKPRYRIVDIAALTGNSEIQEDALQPPPPTDSYAPVLVSAVPGRRN